MEKISAKVEIDLTTLKQLGSNAENHISRQLARGLGNEAIKYANRLESTYFGKKSFMATLDVGDAFGMHNDLISEQNRHDYYKHEYFAECDRAEKLDGALNKACNLIAHYQHIVHLRTNIVDVNEIMSPGEWLDKVLNHE